MDRGLTVITPAYLAAFVLFAVWCYGRERRGRTVHVVAALVWVALLDAVIFSDTAAGFLNGLFHPAILGQNVRTVQLLIPFALAAHVAYHGFPRRWAPTAWVWLAFAAWVCFATLNGLLAGFESGLVMRQASILLYVLGMVALVAATPIADLIDRRRLTVFLGWVSGLAAVLTVATLTGFSVTSSALPELPVLGLGALGSDVASLFVTIGLVLGFVELASSDRRGW